MLAAEFDSPLTEQDESREEPTADLSDVEEDEDEDAAHGFSLQVV